MTMLDKYFPSHTVTEEIPATTLEVIADRVQRDCPTITRKVALRDAAEIIDVLSMEVAR